MDCDFTDEYDGVMRIPNSVNSIILIVDDHLDSANPVAKLLSLEGYTTEVARSCADAMQRAETNALGLLLCDISLPDGDGCDLLSRIRKLHPMLPAISLSGYQSDKDTERYAMAGFNLSLSKPVDFTTLLNSLQKVLGRQANVDNELFDAVNVA